MKLRKVIPNVKSWDEIAHQYQWRAVDHLCSRGSAALFLDPGMGKTAVTLKAFSELKDAGIAKKMLVIAPMRVCQLVWRQEANKWSEFRDLRIVNLAGKTAEERKRLLRADADIWLINPESVDWLCKQFGGPLGRLPFDTLVIDELTKFKNSRAGRSKALQPLADKAARRWGLTGTPVPNGYMDLFGQMKMIDGGAALGKFITHYRDRFFAAGRDGFSYELRQGADKQIEKLVEPYVFRASSEDYLTLPPLIENRITLQLPKDIKAQYKAMKRDMILAIEGQTITAANSAAVYNKLQQFAGGAMYHGESKEYVRIHDVKLDAVKDLVDELQGAPVLIAYAYGHELERLRERFPDAPYLGGGVSGREAERIEEAWNAGKIPVLLCHPASAGHGLNMQLGGAGHLCWFTQTWDYELYDQFIRRIHRQGNSAERIVMHKLVVEETIDELVEDALQGKETTQDALLTALKSEIIGSDPKEGETDMRKLTSAGAAAPQQAPVTQAAPAAQEGAPRGWGTRAPAAAPAQQAAPAPQEAPAGNAAPKGWGTQAFTAPANHATAQPAPTGGLGHFSTAVQQQVLEQGGVDPAFATNAPNTPPFEGGYQEGQAPVLDSPPAEEKKTRRRNKTAVEALTQQVEEGVTSVGGIRAPDFYMNVNLDGVFRAALEHGADVDTALGAVAAVVDHLRGKE